MRDRIEKQILVSAPPEWVWRAAYALGDADRGDGIAKAPCVGVARVRSAFSDDSDSEVRLTDEGKSD